MTSDNVGISFDAGAVHYAHCKNVECGAGTLHALVRYVQQFPSKWSIRARQ